MLKFWGFVGRKKSTDKQQALYHEWRASTARFVGDFLTAALPETSGYHSVIQYIKDVLYKFSTARKDEFMNELTFIVDRAIHLDLKMQQQRANFIFICPTCEPKSGEHNFDSETMDIRLGTARKAEPVYLFVTPLLLRYGTPEGGDYNCYTLVERGEVDLDLPPKVYPATEENTKYA